MYPLLNSYIIVLFGYLNCCTRSLKSWENCFKNFFSRPAWYENMKKASVYFMIWKKQVHILNQRYGDVLFCCTGSDKNIFSDRETLRRTDRRTDGHGDYNLPPPTKQKENKSFEEYKANIFNLLPRYIFSV